MSGSNMGTECSLRRRTDRWRITGQIYGGIFGYGILLECRSRVPHGTLGEQLRHETSPEGAARQCRGTTWGWNVARGSGAAMSGSNMGTECSLRRRTDRWRITGQIYGGIFGYGILLECRSRVPHGTHGEQLKHETSPEGVGQYPWGTIKVKNVARGCHTTPLGNN